MFVVSAPVILPMCMNITTNNVTHLWHYIYGDFSFKGIDKFIKKDMVKGMPSLKVLEETCSDFLTGKQDREVMPKHASWRSKEKL